VSRSGSMALAIAGAVMALAACGSTTSARDPTTTLPVAKSVTAPKGWSPVSFGNVQISVPPTWVVWPNGHAICSQRPGAGDGVVYLNAAVVTYDSVVCTAQPASEVLVDHLAPHAHLPKSTRKVVNGIPVEVPLLSLQSGPINDVRTTYYVPTLGAQITAAGPLSMEVLRTLTHSPLSVITADAPRTDPPSSWVRVSHDAISFAVPPRWTVLHTHNLPCGSGLLANQVLLFPSERNVVYGCPAEESTARAGAGVPGASVIVGAEPLAGDLLRTVSVHGLEIKVLKTSEISNVLEVAVHVPGRAQATVVHVGMTGNGSEARAIVDSIRAAGT